MLVKGEQGCGVYLHEALLSITHLMIVQLVLQLLQWEFGRLGLSLGLLGVYISIVKSGTDKFP